jgi:hypothetical protein
MVLGQPKFFDSTTAPPRRERHGKSELRYWIIEALRQMAVNQWMIVPGSETTKSRGNYSRCANRAIDDLHKSLAYKRREYSVYSSDQGIVITRTA